jgi:hypothetical protein
VPKLQCAVAKTLDAVIARVRVRENCSRTIALEYLIHLARLKPDYSPREFTGTADCNCTLQLAADSWKLFADYRESHDPILAKQGEFFRTALAQGGSLYLDGYRLSSGRDFEDCSLIARSASNGRKTKRQAVG